MAQVNMVIIVCSGHKHGWLRETRASWAGSCRWGEAEACKVRSWRLLREPITTAALLVRAETHISLRSSILPESILSVCMCVCYSHNRNAISDLVVEMWWQSCRWEWGTQHINRSETLALESISAFRVYHSWSSVLISGAQRVPSDRFLKKIILLLWSSLLQNDHMSSYYLERKRKDFQAKLFCVPRTNLAHVFRRLGI